MEDKLIYSELTYQLNGIFFDVRNELGRYCNEKQYCDAIEHKLKVLNISHEREKILPPAFEGEAPGRNKVDFLIADKIILEIKAKYTIGREDYFQSQRYLSALNKKLALLVNFRAKFLQIKRALNARAKI